MCVSVQATEYASSMLHLHAEMLQDTASGIWQGMLVGSMEGMATGVMAGYFCAAICAEIVCNVMYHRA